MRKRFKIFNSWILILTIAVNALPGAMAMDINHDIETQKNGVEPVSLANIDQHAVDSKIPLGTGENHCPHPYASETCHSFSLYTPTANPSSVEFVPQKNTAACCDRVASRYPELPKRPPKA